MRPAEVGGPVADYRKPHHDPSGSLKHEKFLESRVNTSLSRGITIHGVNDVLGN